jgi:hypothetical protein
MLMGVAMVAGDMCVPATSMVMGVRGRWGR